MGSARVQKKNKPQGKTCILPQSRSHALIIKNLAHLPSGLETVVQVEVQRHGHVRVGEEMSGAQVFFSSMCWLSERLSPVESFSATIAIQVVHDVGIGES